MSSALPKRSLWNTNSPNGALHDTNAGAIGQVECCRRGGKQVTGWYIPLELSSSMVTMVAGGPGRDSLHSVWAERRKNIQLHKENNISSWLRMSKSQMWRVFLIIYFFSYFVNIKTHMTDKVLT